MYRRFEQDAVVIEDQKVQAFWAAHHDDVICFICLAVLTEPVRLPCCSQLCCNRCLEDHRTVQQRNRVVPDCPTCRAPLLPTESILPCPEAIEFVQQLQVRCECEETVRLADFLKHKAQVCIEQIQLCSNKPCALRLKRKEMHSHVHDLCAEGLIPCTQCQEVLKRRLLPQHLLEACPNTAVSCDHAPHGCLLQVERKLIVQHQVECEHRQVECPACHECMPFRQLQRHHAVSCPEGATECHFCRVALTHRTLPPHLASDCPNVMVACMYRDTGCVELVVRQSIHEHHAACAHRTVACQYCAQNMQFQQVAHHEGSVCGKRPTRCETCAAFSGLVEELDAHLRQYCKGVERVCSRDATHRIMGDMADLNTHEESTCDARPVTCCHAGAFQCTWTGPFRMAEQHQADVVAHCQVLHTRHAATLEQAMQFQQRTKQLEADVAQANNLSESLYHEAYQARRDGEQKAAQSDLRIRELSQQVATLRQELIGAQQVEEPPSPWGDDQQLVDAVLHVQNTFLYIKERIVPDVKDTRLRQVVNEHFHPNLPWMRAVQCAIADALHHRLIEPDDAIRLGTGRRKLT